MNDFASSSLGQLREIVGNRLLLLPGARIVILDEKQRILLHKRTDFGVWGLPGGNAEVGEDLTSVIIRETEEETGLQIFDPKAFGFGSTPSLETVTYPNGDQAQYFTLNFYCDRFEGIAKINDDESTDIGWFEIGQLPELLPNMYASIMAYERFLTTGQFQMF